MNLILCVSHFLWITITQELWQSSSTKIACCLDRIHLYKNLSNFIFDHSLFSTTLWIIFIQAIEIIRKPWRKFWINYWTCIMFLYYDYSRYCLCPEVPRIYMAGTTPYCTVINVFHDLLLSWVWQLLFLIIGELNGIISRFQKFLNHQQHFSVILHSLWLSRL